MREGVAEGRANEDPHPSPPHRPAAPPPPRRLQVINVIYFQALLWLCAPYFPYVTVFAPVALLATFKFDELLLAKAMAKPSNPWAAEEVRARRPAAARDVRRSLVRTRRHRIYAPPSRTPHRRLLLCARFARRLDSARHDARCLP